MVNLGGYCNGFVILELSLVILAFCVFRRQELQGGLEANDFTIQLSFVLHRNRGKENKNTPASFHRINKADKHPVVLNNVVQYDLPPGNLQNPLTIKK